MLSCCCHTGGSVIKLQILAPLWYFQSSGLPYNSAGHWWRWREKVDNALKKTTMAKSWPAARAVENTNPLACTLQAGHSDVAFAVAVVHLIRMLVHALKRSFGFLSFFFFHPFLLQMPVLLVVVTWQRLYGFWLRSTWCQSRCDPSAAWASEPHSPATSVFFLCINVKREKNCFVVYDSSIKWVKLLSLFSVASNSGPPICSHCTNSTLRHACD